MKGPHTYTLEEPPRFSRQWWVNSGKNGFWVVLATLLIWTFAEMESTPTRELDATLVLTTGKSPVMTLQSKVERRISFTVRGDRTAIDRLENRLVREMGSVVTFDVSGRAKLGEENYLEVRPLLEQTAGRAKSGLSVVSASPSVIKYDVVRPRMELRTTLTLSTGTATDLMFLPGFKPAVDVSFVVEGNSNTLQAFADRLRQGETKLTYDISPDAAPGTRDYRTADLIAKAADVERLGLDVASATPPVLAVPLDRRMTVNDVEVKFDYEGATLAKEAEIKPARMAIQVAESLWPEIQKQLPPGARPVLRTHRMDLKTYVPDGPNTVKAEVVPAIAGIGVEPEQSSVSVTFRVTQRIATRTITVVVRVLWPGDESWKDFDLKRKDPLEWRTQVQVTGSRKDLDQLDEKDVDAYIVIREDDKKPVSWLIRQVEIRFPPELQLKVVGEKPSVSFRLEPRPRT